MPPSDPGEPDAAGRRGARFSAMARLFFSKRANLAEHASQFQLIQYHPDLQLEGLATGVDNLRHDVCLSPRFCDIARTHITRLLARHGGVEDLIGVSPATLGGPPMSAHDRRIVGNVVSCSASGNPQECADGHVATCPGGCP